MEGVHSIRTAARILMLQCQGFENAQKEGEYLIILVIMFFAHHPLPEAMSSPELIRRRVTKLDKMTNSFLWRVGVTMG